MYSKKRSYGAGVLAGNQLSAMSTGALMKKARSYEAAKTLRNRAPRIKGAIAVYGGRQELKYLDTSISQELNTTGVVTPINLIAVGDDNTSRDGRQATIKSVQVHLRLIKFATTSVEKVRVMLVWDNAVNSGSAPALQGTILDNAVISSPSDNFPKIDNAQRFTILADRLIALGPFSTTATQSVATDLNLTVDFYKKMNSVVQYSGTTAAIGSIQNGGLYLVTCGSLAAGSCSAVQGGTRIRFTDY